MNILLVDASTSSSTQFVLAGNTQKHTHTPGQTSTKSTLQFTLFYNNKLCQIINRNRRLDKCGYDVSMWIAVCCYRLRARSIRMYISAFAIYKYKPHKYVFHANNVPWSGSRHSLHSRHHRHSTVQVL